MAFYSAVAALIPLLVLAAILELQPVIRRIEAARRDPPTRPSLWLVGWIGVGVLSFFASSVLAEVIALDALLHGPPGEIGRETTQIALVSATALLLQGSVIPFVTMFDEAVGRWVRWVFLALWGLGFTAALLVIAID